MLVARRLESCVRQTDVVARFGGDEFAILLDGMKDSLTRMDIAEKVLQTIAVGKLFKSF